MMKMTTKELEVLENLTVEQAGVFVKYGAEMFRKGIIKGAIWFGVGVVAAQTVAIVKEIHKYYKETKKRSE